MLPSAQKLSIADIINVIVPSLISSYITVSAKKSPHDLINGIAKSIYPSNKRIIQIEAFLRWLLNGALHQLIKKRMAVTFPGGCCSIRFSNLTLLFYLLTIITFTFAFLRCRLSHRGFSWVLAGLSNGSCTNNSVFKNKASLWLISCRRLYYYCWHKVHI